MAFKKKTWLGRIAEFPNRRRLTKEDGSSELVTVSREEGQISQEGDAFSPENFNDLEERIDQAINELNEGCIQPSVKNFDGNFVQKAIVRTYGCKNGNNNTYQIMGRTIIPFNWSGEYAIVQNCKPGSFIYAINVTKNTTHYLYNVDSNGGLYGLSANAGDIIVFFGMAEFTS